MSFASARRRLWTTLIDENLEPKWWFVCVGAIFLVLLPTLLYCLWGTTAVGLAQHICTIAGIVLTYLALQSANRQHRDVMDTMAQWQKNSEESERSTLPLAVPTTQAPPLPQTTLGPVGEFLNKSHTKDCGALALGLLVRASHLGVHALHFRTACWKWACRDLVHQVRANDIYRLAYGFALAARCAGVVDFTIHSGKWDIGPVHPDLQRAFQADDPNHLLGILGLSLDDLDEIVRSSCRG